MLKKIALLAATAVICTASTIPVGSPDGVTVTGPGIGRAVIPLAGQTWQVCGNDNFGDSTPGGDNDFNEPCGLAVFGEAGTFTFDLLFNVTAYDNTLGVLGQPGGIDPSNTHSEYVYTPGEEVIFDQWVHTLGVHLYSGDGSRNADGIPYVWTAQLGTPDQQSDTPEPSSLLILGATFLICYLICSRNHK